MSDNWNGTGSWTATTPNPNWSTTNPPTPGQATEIQTGTVTLTAAGTTGTFQIDAPAYAVINTGGVLTASGATSVIGILYLEGGGAASITGGLSITGSGALLVDSPYNGNGGGSSLSISGTLTNNSTNNNGLDIGYGGLATSDTVTAGGLVNSGTSGINLQGNVYVQNMVTVTAEATLDITAAAGFGTLGVETGSVSLTNAALLEFASGQITTIDGTLTLNGANALVADAGTLGSNSALTGLSTVAGEFELGGGASVSTTGGLTITGNALVLVDSPYNGYGGGTTLSIGGTLTNNSTNNNGLAIGYGGLATSDTVTASGLVNSGTSEINLQGNVYVQNMVTVTAQATLDITAAAGFGTLGVETGTVYLTNAALLEFASGQITTIDGTLSLNGANALVADAGTLGSNSALTGLSTVAGEFELGGGASVSTTGGLTITGSGLVLVDSPYNGYGGGSSLSIGGTLTNNSTNGQGLDIGYGGLSTSDTVTASGLVNSGTTRGFRPGGAAGPARSRGVAGPRRRVSGARAHRSGAGGFRRCRATRPAQRRGVSGARQNPLPATGLRRRDAGFLAGDTAVAAFVRRLRRARQCRSAGRRIRSGDRRPDAGDPP
jgi:hypothetical protein